MKAIEVKLTQYNYSFELCYSRNAHNQNSGLNIEKIKKGYSIWNLLLNNTDIKVLEYWLNENGLTGEYKYTKNHHWVRCQNLLSKEQLLNLTRWLRTNKVKFGAVPPSSFKNL